MYGTLYFRFLLETLVHAAQQAKESGRPVEHLIDNLFPQTSETK
jgi:hypothetical protein